MKKKVNVALKSLCLAFIAVLCIGLIAGIKVHAEDYEELKYTTVNSYDELVEKFKSNETILDISSIEFLGYTKILHFIVNEDGWFAIRSYNYKPQVFIYSNNMFTEKIQENMYYENIGGKDYSYRIAQQFYLTKGDYWIEYNGNASTAFHSFNNSVDNNREYGDHNIKLGYFFLPSKILLSIDSITYSDNNSVANVTFKPISKNIEKMYIFDTKVSLQPNFFSDSTSHKYMSQVSWVSDREKEFIKEFIANGFEITGENGTYTLCLSFYDDEYKSFPVAVSFTIDQIGAEAAKIEAKSVKLNKTKATLKIGDTLALKTTLKPKNVTDKTITWKSSNTKVATVNENGVVTAKKKGTCTITATSSSGKKAKCKITVKK